MRIQVLTYNIHKGFQHSSRKRVLHWIRDALRELPADIVFLQEILGFETQAQASQLEFLADSIWHHFAYGKNALTSLGHHGNAILSRFPITRFENIDVSTNALERRGILHAELFIPGLEMPLHALCLHLGLMESDRRSQIRRVCHRIYKMTHRRDPVLVGGDLNDWRERASPILKKRLQFEEAHLSVTGNHARTFPSWMPALRLDRVYFRGLKVIECQALIGPPWTKMSDHLPLYAVFEIDLPPRTACSSEPRS